MSKISSAKTDFKDYLLSMDRTGAEIIIQELTKSNHPFQIAENLITPVLEEIGREWEEGELALSQVYMSGRICEELIDLILPPKNPDRKNNPKIAVATLEDHHILGKRIVYSILRATGYDLFDYNTVNGEELVSKTLEDSIEVLLISTLMLPSAIKAGEVISKLKKANPGIKIMVGGAPFRFDPSLGKEIGADRTGKNASEAIDFLNHIEKEGN